MKTRLLRDIEVSEVGMGCMAFSHGYGKIPEEEYSIEAIRMPTTTAAPSLIQPKSTARTLPVSAITNGSSVKP